MEEKESTISGSLGNSDTDSPPAPVSSLVLPQVMNMDMHMNINMSLERSLGSAATETATAGGVGAGGATITTATAIPGSGGGTLGSPGSGLTLDSLGKKKRGRPRKYDADGNLRLPYQLVTTSPPGFTLSPSSPTEFSSSKRGRGRPPGSGNWQLVASLGELFANTAGGDFTPHVVTVNTGEDVAGKILSFSEKGPRGICILSANGAVSNVTIRQPGSSGGILTYEGRFEILSLTGSFTVSDTGGVKNRTGGLSVSLAGPDGRVIGGGLAGILVAASPIQIVVGSFMPNGYKVHKRKHHREHTVASTVAGAPSATVTAARVIAEGKPGGENCMTPASPFPGENLGEADNNTINKNIANAALSLVAGWNNGSEPTSIHRPYPDINVSVPSE
ncbi:AT-hook motif nuclear-localized protein 7-like [Durio zibethinus]|uniref:AT-hook motif nuclear-localized protein n=1 Tax=Durio zibethinus TaxID=66656 RepID=A0A6P5YUN0_DURZI|nr:AT-hook motif nuclear-localized protein 7-like [Durio zibethinus]XP_022744288.1 AT-hook motif nuclear-localized protein 7-like [Durio zibethinus]